MIVGIIGLIFLILAWSAQIFDIVKNRKSDLNLKLAFFYFMGTIFLTFYAIQIKDIIFTVLQIFLILVTGLSIIFALKYK